MQSAVPTGLLLIGRFVAVAGVMLAAFFTLFGLDLYEPQLRPVIGVWLGLPLPLGYWAGGKLARDAASFALVVAGLIVVLVGAAWVYWEITFGETRRTESMSGLLFLFGPLYQYAALAFFLLIAWLVGRRAKPAE